MSLGTFVSLSAFISRTALCGYNNYYNYRADYTVLVTIIEPHFEQ